MEAALNDEGAWKKLSYLTDHIGSRLSGSTALEHAVLWAQDTLKREGHENVHAEKVMVPHWVRGKQSVAIVEPIMRPLHVLTLGGSVGTALLEAEVIIVQDFPALSALGAAVKGKIVLFNKAMPSFNVKTGAGYGETVQYRSKGPMRAAEAGAVAVLVRSLTVHSLSTPHTGATRPNPTGTNIPAVSVSTEDADLLARLNVAGTAVRVKMELGAQFLPDAPSANIIAELRGRTLPEEVVIISAHLDSWDVGQGAHDDGAGCVMAMQALTILRRLDLRPRRTIRVVLYTNEENGLRGARAYAKEHEAELKDHVAAIESDSGGFKPQGYALEAPEGSKALVHAQDMVTLLAQLGADHVELGHGGADIGVLGPKGVPLLGHKVDMSKYFDYHHTDADTLDKVNPEQLKQNVAAMAVMAYVIADMPQRFGE